MMIGRRRTESDSRRFRENGSLTNRTGELRYQLRRPEHHAQALLLKTVVSDYEKPTQLIHRFFENQRLSKMRDDRTTV